MIPPLIRLAPVLALLVLAALPVPAQVAPIRSEPVITRPVATEYAPMAFSLDGSRQRPAGVGDLALLALGGVGGGIAAAILLSSADPAPAVGAAAYGLGVAAGATMAGRLFRVDGSPLGALAGAAAGSGIVLLAAHSGDNDGLAAATEVALLALALPPLLSTGGYVLAPTLLGSRSPGLSLYVDL